MRSQPDSEILDSTLLAQYALKADDTAFDRLFGKYRRLVFEASKAVLGQDESAEDAVGATFLLLAKHAGRLSRRPSIAGWLYDTASLTARNVKRMEQGQLRKLTRFGEHLRFEQGSGVGNELILDEALGALPVQARKALLLKFVQGFTYSEVGETLNCSEDAARQRVQRALTQLAQMLSTSGLAVTADRIEEAMTQLSVPVGPLRPWLSRQSSTIAEHVARARQITIARNTAAAMGILLLGAFPLLSKAQPGRLNSSADRPLKILRQLDASTVRPSKPIPALTSPFTLVYDELAQSEGLPDQRDTLTISYDGKTLLMERSGLAKVTSLINGDRLEMFTEGGHAYGLPPDVATVPMTIETDFKSFDPSRDEWLGQPVKHQSPPLTRFTAITNVPPVGASLPNPTFRITLDGSYSWFMGDSRTAIWNPGGHLVRFGAYDTFYELSDYRLVGSVPVAGRVIVTRTSGDFRGPNSYTLKSAATTALPAAKFKLATYQIGDLMATAENHNDMPCVNKVYVPVETPADTKRKLKEFFAKNVGK